MIEEVSTSNKTNAGICPKTNQSIPWQDPDDAKSDKYYPPALPVPGNQSWCGEDAASICTFPFFVSGSDLYYVPYENSSPNSSCGTKDDSYIPIDVSGSDLNYVPYEGSCGTDDDSYIPVDYSSVDKLETANPCKGEY